MRQLKNKFIFFTFFAKTVFRIEKNAIFAFQMD